MVSGLGGGRQNNNGKIIMKITATVRQVLYHTIDVDLNDYFDSAEEKTQTKICELFQSVKDNPLNFVHDTKDGLMTIDQCDETSVQDLEFK